MTVSAALFGAIGTLAETSDLQRKAFNAAFAEAELPWVWNRDTYRMLLTKPGGRARIARQAQALGVEDQVDIDALYQSKLKHFGERLHAGIYPRSGVQQVMRVARVRGIKIGFATTTGKGQVDDILNGLSAHIERDQFDWIGHGGLVSKGKPSPEIYEVALKALGVSPAEAIAIEDTPESAEAALAAGLRTIGFPGAAAERRSFPEGVTIMRELSATLLDDSQRIAAE